MRRDLGGGETPYGFAELLMLRVIDPTMSQQG